MQDHELKLPQELIYDRGGKGRKQMKDVTIITPDKPKTIVRLLVYLNGKRASITYCQRLDMLTIATLGDYMRN